VLYDEGIEYSFSRKDSASSALLQYGLESFNMKWKQCGIVATFLPYKTESPVR